MAIYVVQARGDDGAELARARFVLDSFSWAAFFLAQFWLLYHRLWLALAIWIAAEVAFFVLVYPHLPGVAAVLVDVLARLCLGLEASGLRLAKEERRTVLTDIVEAANRDEAEAAFFRRHLLLPAARDEAA